MTDTERQDILPKNALPAKPTQVANTSNVQETRVDAKTRVSMSTKQAKLAVPNIPGFHLHWAVSRNVPRMRRAGYEFVNQDEVDINNFDIAGDPGMSGSSDLGSRISVAAGTDVDSGRLYLMKLPEAFWNEDCKKMEEANEAIAASIRGGNIGDSSADHQTHKYLKEGQKLFYPQNKR